MTLREHLYTQKKIIFDIKNDMGYEVLIDSHTLPGNSVQKVHDKIEAWYREATQMPDHLHLELEIYKGDIEWTAVGTDNHNWDNHTDFIDEVINSLKNSDEPEERFSINFSAEGVFSESETCIVTDLYFCHFTQEDEEVEIELSDKQMKLLQSMIIEFVRENPCQSLDLAADNSYSINVDTRTVSFTQEGCPEISQDLLDFIDLDAEI
jgi:hypothetical protein